jgi:transposase
VGRPARAPQQCDASLACHATVLTFHRAPAYAPDLSPVEGQWSGLKAVELANLTAPTLADVI